MIPVVKSPSESTIYTPVLMKVKNRFTANHIIDRISNFVESIRMESSDKGTPQRSTPRASITPRGTTITPR